VLLIPRIFECLPQRIDHASFLLALHMAAEAGNPYFRLGYNSLGAFATINHLHFQVLIAEQLENRFDYQILVSIDYCLIAFLIECSCVNKNMIF
jgi:hypothetical protein